MKRLTLLLLAVCIFSAVYAIKTEDRYVMKTFDGGQLYFILPYDIPALTVKTKALSADITYLTTSDSLTMNLSVWAADELTTDSIVVEGDVRIAICDFRTFFIEPDGKQFLHRYSLRYPLNILTALYRSASPFTISVYAQGHEIRYAYSSKSWNKEQIWMNKILHIIDSNKRFYR